MFLTKFQDPKMGYLINDACIIEAELDVVALNAKLKSFNELKLISMIKYPKHTLSSLNTHII